MEQIASLEGNSRPSSEEIPLVLWKPNVYFMKDKDQFL
jgi:hypothetical protein